MSGGSGSDTEDRNREYEDAWNLSEDDQNGKDKEDEDEKADEDEDGNGDEDDNGEGKEAEDKTYEDVWGDLDKDDG